MSFATTNVSGLASLAAVVSVRGKDKDKDEFDNAISKFILLGHF